MNVPRKVIVLAGISGSLLACRPSSDTVTPMAGIEIRVEPASPTDPTKPFSLPDDDRLFTAMDVFELEWAAAPKISPDGRWIAYVRGSMDRLADRKRSQIWLLSSDGKVHEPLTTRDQGNAWAPRWSPTGNRLAYVANTDRGAQLFVHWLESGRVTTIADLTNSPSDIEWSPQGDQLAFVMHVESDTKPLVKLPKAPKGANWAEAPRIIEEMSYREDGGGYIKPGFHHVFVVPADAGTPRQVTSGDFHHDEPTWTPDGKALIVVSNRLPDWDRQLQQSELYAVRLADRSMTQLTDRLGPDESPSVSPDGQHLAYIGFDDERKGHHVRRLYVRPLAGGPSRSLTDRLDRSVRQPVWAKDGQSIYFAYDDRGNGKVAAVSMTGEIREIVRDLGGLSLGRPYGSGAYDVADDGTVVWTMSRPEHPADLARIPSRGGKTLRLTRLNEDLFANKLHAKTEEIWVESSHDRTPIQAWVMTPPGFDPQRKYPLILEIHGGPFANYGNRFAAEFQLYASAGYVVVYANPRGSTSYGNAFANEIHHAYPGHDYDDLMSVVAAVVERGSIDPKRLFVTGGSGGGVLTSWIVGKTNQFRAAAVVKPVINWYSFVLTADHAPFFVDYWFPGPPWEQTEHYLARSPLSLVGNVKTPTMLLTGEADYRTPISETEQYYQALKLRGIDTAMVRVPGASHSIAARPSQLIAKVAYVLGWFHRYFR